MASSTDVPFGGTLTGLLDYWATNSPSDSAIIWQRGQIDFASLADASKRVATALAGLGVKPGGTVALWMPNCPAWMATFFGCAYLGVRVAAINSRFTLREVQDILRRTGAEVLFCWPAMMDLDLGGFLESMDDSECYALSDIVIYGEGDSTVLPTPFSGHNYHRLVQVEPGTECNAAPDAGAVLFTTSGSTGRPKLVLHNQQGLTTHAAEVAQVSGLRMSGTVTLQPMPLCGGFGLCQMLSALAAGKPAVIQDRWDIEHMAHLINLHQVTNFCGTDELIIRLLATSALERPFPSVRWCGYATFSAGLGDWFASAEGRGLRPVGLYGASEVQALYAIQRPSDPISLRCVDGGFAVSRQARVRVRDGATGNLLSNGALGELELFGPSSMVGYDGDRATTMRAMTPDGFVHIGDYGRVLENGSFIFEGRSGDWIRVSGFLVAPTEIETLVEGLPNILGCRVVGADWKGVQRPFAFVTLHKGTEFDEHAVLAACAAHLARHKVPVRVAQIDEFPITDGPNGVKIKKHILQTMAAASLEQLGKDKPLR